MKLKQILNEIKLNPQVGKIDTSFKQSNFSEKLKTEDNINLLRHYYKKNDQNINAKIAINPNAPIEILWDYAKRGSQLVRNQLIFNKNLPDEIKQFLIENENWIANIEYICRYFYLTNEQIGKFAKKYNYSDGLLYNIKLNKTLDIGNKELIKIFRESGVDKNTIRRVFYN